MPSASLTDTSGGRERGRPIERGGDRATSETTVRVGVLSLHNSKETKAIQNAVEALGHDTEWLRSENTVVRFETGTARLSPDVDVVPNRLLLSNTDQPTEELGLAQTLEGIRPMLNAPDATARAAHKTAAAVGLVDAGLPVPRTALALSNERLNRIPAEFDHDAVDKTAIGTHGGGLGRYRPRTRSPAAWATGARSCRNSSGEAATTPRTSGST